MPKHVVRYETKYIKTREDWYPTVDGQVQVRTMQLTDGHYYISLWGGDDYGLEADVEDAAAARKLFNQITDFTSKAQLLAWGFKNA